MREIDPIREPSEALLSSALHRLVKAEKRNAPPELGANLVEKFRHHHRRRRQLRWAVVGALAACLLALVGIAGMQHKVRTVHRQNPPPAAEQAPAVAAAGHQAIPLAKPRRLTTKDLFRYPATIQQSPAVICRWSGWRSPDLSCVCWEHAWLETCQTDRSSPISSRTGTERLTR